MGSQPHKIWVPSLIASRASTPVSYYLIPANIAATRAALCIARLELPPENPLTAALGWQSCFLLYLGRIVIQSK